MKRLASMSIFASVLAVATVAYATDYSKEGRVGDIRLIATSGYDEFWLAGKPDVCGSAVDADWRARVRIERTIGNYEEIMRALLAARLSGARVKVTAADNAEDRCVLKNLTVLEP